MVENVSSTTATGPKPQIRRLGAEEWNRVLIRDDLRPALLQRIRDGVLTEWGRAIVEQTESAWSVLEVGSGTGEISLHLAAAGRNVWLFDLSMQSLRFSYICAAEAGLSINGLQSDALSQFSFSDDAFDCVWSSGLLEHFTAEERHFVLAEKRRVSRDQVISLVPNAASVAYRAGKAYQEERGIWPYGHEIPLHSMREEFEAAGLRVESEFTLDERHALNFLPDAHHLREALGSWIESMPASEIESCRQGYLLMTVGRK